MIRDWLRGYSVMSLDAAMAKHGPPSVILGYPKRLGRKRLKRIEGMSMERRTYTKCPKCGREYGWGAGDPVRTPLTHGEWMYECLDCGHRWSSRPIKERPERKEGDQQ